MSKNDTVENPESITNLTAEQLGTAIGNAVAQGVAATAGPKKVTFGQYIKRPHTAFHKDRANGKAIAPADMPKLTRHYFDNNRALMEHTLFANEINLLNRITHSGRYIERKVEVIVNREGSEEVVILRYNNTKDAAFELKGLARNFEDMLQQIVDAQEIEDAEEAEWQASRKGKRQGKSGV